MWLGTRANSQAALPAFVLGLVMSSHYVQHRQEQDRIRVVAFAFLTPFFFLKGGMNVSTAALSGRPRHPGAPLRRQDGPEADRRLSARPPVHRTSRGLHDSAHVDGADLRNDHLALRPQRTHHRSHAVSLLIAVVVLFRDRSNRNRATLLLTNYRGATRPDRSRRPRLASGALSRKAKLIRPELACASVRECPLSVARSSAAFASQETDVTIARCLIQPFGTRKRSTDCTSPTRSSAKDPSTWSTHRAGSPISRQSGRCRISATFSASSRARFD